MEMARESHARLAHEVFDFLGAGVGMGFVGDFVLNAGENAELAFDRDVMGMGVFDNLLGEGDVVVIGVRGAVDHDGGEPVVNARLAEFESVAVVEVQDDRDIAAELLGVFARALGHVAQERLVGVLARAAGHLQNHGRLLLDASLDNRLHLLHIIEVKRGDSIFAVDSFFEKLARIDQTEFFI